MQIIITKSAEDDLSSIVLYVTVQNPMAAERIYNDIKGNIFGLLEFPQKGRVGRIANTRELVMAGLPFIIVYSVNELAVTILAVFHAKMDLTQHLEDRTKSC
jgi:plasmid stabilization system protein ParE